MEHLCIVNEKKILMKPNKHDLQQGDVANNDPILSTIKMV